MTGGLGFFFFFFQAEDGIRDLYVTGVQTCALPIFEPEEREDPQTGKRQVRMRVPYLGYEPYEPPSDVDTPATLAPVDGWRQPRAAPAESKQPPDDDFAF